MSSMVVYDVSQLASSIVPGIVYVMNTQKTIIYPDTIIGCVPSFFKWILVDAFERNYGITVANHDRQFQKARRMIVAELSRFGYYYEQEVLAKIRPLAVYNDTQLTARLSGNSLILKVVV